MTDPAQLLFEKLPPQDVAAEQAVLGGMLLSREQVAEVGAVLKAVDFYQPQHAVVFEVICDLFAAGKPTDTVAVSAEMRQRGLLGKITGGPTYLHTLMTAVPSAGNTGYYAQIVSETATLRRLIQAGVHITQMGYGAVDDVPGAPTPQVMDKAQQLLFDVMTRGATSKIWSVEDLLQSTMDEIDAIAAQGPHAMGVPTGFTKLDQMTNGLQPGNMIVVAARPAYGKSTLGLDLARSASIKNGLASAVFSLEMTRSELMMRLLSAEAMVPLHHMRAGTMTDADWKKLANIMSNIADAPMFIDDDANIGMMEIRAKVRRLKQQHDLRLVIVDYLQLMTNPLRTFNRQEEVSDISRQMKLMAKEVEVAVVAISQLNRNPESRHDKKPQLSDLRESGSLEQDCDICVLLHREDMSGQETERVGEADLILAKNRNGPTGVIPLAFQGHFSRFAEIDE